MSNHHILLLVVNGNIFPKDWIDSISLRHYYLDGSAQSSYFLDRLGAIRRTGLNDDADHYKLERSIPPPNRPLTRRNIPIAAFC
jgi:hypothetical protein